MQKQPYRRGSEGQKIPIKSIKSMQKSSISLTKSNISSIKSLNNMVMYHQINQLDKNLEDESNKRLPPPKTPLLEAPTIDLKLSNTLNFLGRAYKPLPQLATPQLKIPMIESK